MGLPIYVTALTFYCREGLLVKGFAKVSGKMTILEVCGCSGT